MGHPSSKDHKAFLTDAIREVDSGVAAVTRWVGEFHRALICGGPVDPGLIGDDSHRRCAFGRWLAGERAGMWEPWQTDLAHIESLHRFMHRHALVLWQRRQDGATITPADYNLFLESSLTCKFALRALGFRLIDEICLIDQLTGVWNRSSMFKRLTEEQDRMLRSGRPCCLCMMDIDHFKGVNDVLGHIAGDRVLQSVIEVAGRRLRAYDAVFRYGGEEFLFCLPDATVEVAAGAMERVRADIEQADISLRDGRSTQVTASFGVAALSSSLPLEDCIEHADRALLCAKSEGRNRVCRWDVQ